MKDNFSVGIVGGGLSGVEAAWQLTRKKIPVTLYEMRPGKTTPAHRSGGLAELVCSNSFKSVELNSPHGLLKAELSLLNSLCLSLAEKARVPAGSALAVDPLVFSQAVEDHLSQEPLVTIRREEAQSLQALQQIHPYLILATGPLTAGAIADELQELTQGDGLYFYDAIAPVIEKESLDLSQVFFASRYGKSGADYLNCPLSRQAYTSFIEALLGAEKVPFKEYEQAKHFEGCLPIEVMAARGIETLAHGPLKPVGLERDGVRPYAVVQLRQENLAGTLYNLVGCQTRMTYGEQKRVFRMLPGLRQAEFARLGSMHRNSYLNAPRYLSETLELKPLPGVFVAGQLTGVEGYVESMATGLWAALQVAAQIQGMRPPQSDKRFMLGGLLRYLSEASPDRFQPMNANFGLLEPIPIQAKLKKQEKRKLWAQAALAYLQSRPWVS